MSQLLESVLDAERRNDCAANDAALGITHAAPARTFPFLVSIGKRGAPRLQFGVLATDWWAAFNQHVDLAEIGERCEVRPVGAQS